MPVKTSMVQTLKKCKIIKPLRQNNLSFSGFILNLNSRPTSDKYSLLLTLRQALTIMNKRIYPALGILISAAILLAVNELTDWSVAEDYGYILIIAGMFIGMRLKNVSKKEK